MIAPLRIPHITQSQPIVDKEGRATNEFLRRLNDIFQQLGEAILAIQQLPEIQAALEAAQAAVVDAQAAADAANAAADNAAAAAAANAKEQALVNSYIDPSSVVSSTPTLISVAAHTRKYGDGTSVSVNAGTVTATAAGTAAYVSYNDPSRTGGAVTYVASTTQPTQGMGIHVVGAVTVPATGTADGGDGPRQPGYVDP